MPRERIVVIRPVLVFFQGQRLRQRIIEAVWRKGSALGHGLLNGLLHDSVQIVVVCDVFVQILRVGAGGMRVDGMLDRLLANGVENTSCADEMLVFDPVPVGESPRLVHIRRDDNLLCRHIDHRGGLAVAGAKVMQFNGLAAHVKGQIVLKGLIHFRHVAHGIVKEFESRQAVYVAEDFRIFKDVRTAHNVKLSVKNNA